MILNKFRTKSFCVDGKLHSGTTNIRGDFTRNKKTGMPVKLLRGVCLCNMKKEINNL